MFPFLATSTEFRISYERYNGRRMQLGVKSGCLYLFPMPPGSKSQLGWSLKEFAGAYIAAGLEHAISSSYVPDRVEP